MKNINSEQINKIKVFYFIGPQGVGKSTICEEISNEKENVIYEELDLIYREYRDKKEIGREEATQKIKDKILEIENLKDDKIHIVDVGNFGQKKLGIPFWRSIKGCIAQLDNEDSFCIKNYLSRFVGRTEEIWRQAENFSDREELYKLVKYKIDGRGKDKKSIKQEILKIIE